MFRMMVASSLFLAFFILPYAIDVCYASNEIAEVINGTWVHMLDDSFAGGDPGLEIKDIEERQYMSRAAMKQKFVNRQTLINTLKAQIVELESKTSTDPATLLSNVGTSITNIADLVTNQNSMKQTLDVKCQELDRLLDPDQHCCINGFSVICVEKVLTLQTGYEWPDDHQAGGCPACPSALSGN